MKVPNDERSSAIKVLYKSILKREADLSGLAAYYQSTLTENEIERDLRHSEEYQILTGVKVKKSSGQLMSNFLIGESPKTPTDVNTLIGDGIKVVVGIGRSPFITYDQNAFEEHYIIPIGAYGKTELENSALGNCIETLHTKVVKERKKTYLHSVDSLEDVVLVATMFKFTLKGGSFTQALYQILISGFPVEIGRERMSPYLIKQAWETRGKVIGKDVLGLAPIYVGTSTPILDPCHQ